MSRGRPGLPIGEHGRVSVRDTGRGNFKATVKVRDPDGRVRPVTAVGKSKGAAERRLQQRLAERRPVNASVGTLVTADTTIEELAEIWLEHRRRHGNQRYKRPLAPQTLHEYAGEIRRILVPGLGGLRVGEVNVQLLQAIWNDLDDNLGVSTRNARGVLNQMLTLAVQLNARHDNPMLYVAEPPREPHEVEALTLEQVHLLRHLVDPETSRTPGRRRPSDALKAVVDTALGTGARIGEVCALQWDQVSDLDTERPLLTIDATMVEAHGTIPYHRQAYTKTRSTRTLFLPDHVADLLRERRDRSRFTAGDDPVITNSGTYLWTNNLRTSLRKAVAGTPELLGVTPHTLRRTVGTTVAHEAGLQAAAEQLGHQIGTSVTAIYYVARRPTAPDLRRLLDPFFRDA